MSHRPRILGQLLQETGAVTAEALEKALETQKGTGLRVGDVLVRMGATDEESVSRALALQLGLPFGASPLQPEPDAVAMVRRELARAHSVVPLRVSARTLVLAMADPLDLAAVDDLRFQTGRRVEAVVATPAAVAEALDLAYDDAFGHLVESLPEELRSRRGAPADDLERATQSAPVVRLVSTILAEAVTRRASDIHIEETGSDVRVRYRVDGVLRRALDLPAASRRAVLSRVKVMAGMDISVRRRAQDGRIALQHQDRSLTLRVSTLPVNGGEKAVVRILDPEAAPASLDALGLSGGDLGRIHRLLSAREGVLLSAGPTGSGKSTSLFAALSEVDRESQNVVTLEDPVEYRLPGANQVQVDRRAGLGFSDALRAVLRQDPDVVMIGEIRDRETAEIAMAAAVTGHLVLSTIHTTDAPGAITRLLNMGVPPFLVAGGLAGVVAQRLVRRVCPGCRGAGCEACGDGHRGRTGVFQVLTVTDALRDEITGDANTSRLRALARDAGMTSLADDARRAVAEGLTTPHEISRVLSADPATAFPCRSCGRGVPMTAVACPSCGAHRKRVCVCGATLERGWRYCPWCVRPVVA
ncbi:MAG: Flp pilus assembly complex ATPase component TadA [Gemmatimonadetes bacterium]|nr:Flp pilus assembly complex ATPase component TadA [Gemmatimonadota bacterium]